MAGDQPRGAVGVRVVEDDDVPVAEVVGRAERGEPAEVGLDDLLDPVGLEDPVLGAQGRVLAEDLTDAVPVAFVHDEPVEDAQLLDRGPVFQATDPLVEAAFGHEDSFELGSAGGQKQCCGQER